MSPKPPARPETAPDRPEPMDGFDRALARWAIRPPRTPASIAARRMVSHLPGRTLRSRGIRSVLGAARSRRATPWLAWAVAALVALGLGLALSSPLLRPGPRPSRLSGPGGAVPPTEANRGAEAMVPGTPDDVLVIDLDERTTLYLDLGRDLGRDLGGT